MEAKAALKCRFFQMLLIDLLWASLSGHHLNFALLRPFGISVPSLLRRLALLGIALSTPDRGSIATARSGLSNPNAVR